MRCKQLLCAALAALMILPIAACGDPGETETGAASATESPADSNETDAESEAETKETLDLPAQRFEGYELTFLGRDGGEWSTVEIIPEDGSEYVNVSEAVTTRNEILADKYGFTLNLIKADTSSFPTKVSQENMAPTGDFQALAPRMDTAGSMASQGYLVNLADEEVSQYMDFSKSWWDGKMAQDLAIDGRIYYATGDILTSDNDGTFALMFNKTIAADIKLPDLYQSVNAGTWTMDQMYNFAQLAKNDKDGDGKLSYDTDVCGFAYTGDSPYAFVYAGGLRIIQPDEDGELAYSLDVSRASDVAEKAKLLFSKEIAVDMNAASGSIVEVGKKCFGEGHALFFGECLQCVSRVRSYDVDFGIIPYPKYDEAQESYGSMMEWVGGVVAIPKSVTGTDRERVAYCMEAIAYHSVDTLTNLYYDLNLKTKNAKDAESGPMIDLILASRVYDIAYTYSLKGVVGNIASTMTSGKKNVASLERASKTSIERGLKELRKSIDKAEKAS
jgi:maltose-binding protein MalE